MSHLRAYLLPTHESAAADGAQDYTVVQILLTRPKYSDGHILAFYIRCTVL